jgi:hypothetical protein
VISEDSWIEMPSCARAKRIVVFDAAAPEIPGFSEQLSCLSPFHNSSSILRTAEFWPEPAVPVCLLTTFDYRIRTDVNWDWLPTNNDTLLLKNNKH